MTSALRTVKTQGCNTAPQHNTTVESCSLWIEDTVQHTHMQLCTSILLATVMCYCDVIGNEHMQNRIVLNFLHGTHRKDRKLYYQAELFLYVLAFAWARFKRHDLNAGQEEETAFIDLKNHQHRQRLWLVSKDRTISATCRIVTLHGRLHIVLFKDSQAPIVVHNKTHDRIEVDLFLSIGQGNLVLLAQRMLIFSHCSTQLNVYAALCLLQKCIDSNAMRHLIRWLCMCLRTSITCIPALISKVHSKFTSELKQSHNCCLGE